MAEAQNIEWKESWRDEYLKMICAFINTEGGELYIGIDDAGILQRTFARELATTVGTMIRMIK